MTLDFYETVSVVFRGIALALSLSFMVRARRHEDERYFDYRRRAVFGYSIQSTLLAALFLSSINVALPSTDVTVSRVAIAIGVAYSIVGYGLLHLGWPGPRREK